MPDIIRKPELYGGRYNGMNLADRTREYERDMYLYTIAKSMQNNNQDESYKHLKMAKDIDSIIEDDYYYEEDYIDEAINRGCKAVGIADIKTVQSFIPAQEYLQKINRDDFICEFCNRFEKLLNYRVAI